MPMNQIIQARRRALGLTQEQVAERLGVTTSAVNKWEKGINFPDVTLLPALARLLAGRDALGWVGSAVTELTLGYLPSENAGTGMRFVPVWRIETDAGSFYVNGITREITPL